MSNPNQFRDKNQAVAGPPTIALRRRAKRFETGHQCCSSTEFIIRRRQQEFEAIIGRAARFTPLQDPPGGKSPKSISRGAMGRGEIDRQRVGIKRFSNRLRDMWPFGRARGGKAQAWG
jgi:hypothetical protein